MARVRIPDELRDQVKNYVEDSAEYDTQSEFVKDAVRQLLNNKQLDLDEVSSEAIREIVKEELEDKS